MLSNIHFQVFSNPEEHEEMFPFLVNQTMREKDTNKDGRVDFNEFIAEKGEFSNSFQQQYIVTYF